MGKRQHQKDKMYITCAEYTQFYGGKKADHPRTNFRRISFDHCSLSLQPFEYPVCTPDGMVFDILSIVPWIKKYGTNPITGEKLDAKSLIKLNFAKNSEGKYHCPVLFTVFTNNSHIVAIKTTGNVFAYEAVEQLNIKPKCYKDLLTDEPFTRQDIVTLQSAVISLVHWEICPESSPVIREATPCWEVVVCKTLRLKLAVLILLEVPKTEVWKSTSYRLFPKCAMD